MTSLAAQAALRRDGKAAGLVTTATAADAAALAEATTAVEEATSAPQPLQMKHSHQSLMGSSSNGSGADVLICSEHPLQAPATATGVDGLARLSMTSCTSFGGNTRSGTELDAAAAAAAAETAPPVVRRQAAATSWDISTTSGNAAGATANMDTTGSYPVPEEGAATQQPPVVAVQSSPDEAEVAHSGELSGCSAAAMLAAASHGRLASKRMSWECDQFLADAPNTAAVSEQGDVFSQQEEKSCFPAVLGEPSAADNAESAEQLPATGQVASYADSGHMGGAEEDSGEGTELQPSMDGSPAAGQLDEGILFASAQPGSAEEADEGVSAYRISAFDEESFSAAPAYAAAAEYQLANGNDSETGAQPANVTVGLTSPESSFSFTAEADREVAPAGQADGSPCQSDTGEDESSGGGNNAELHASIAQASEPQSASPPEEGDLLGRSSSALHEEVAAADPNDGVSDAAAESAREYNCNSS